MRDSYREQLDDILADLVHMAQVVSAAVRTSTTALLEADLKLAEQVITDDEKLDAKQADIEAAPSRCWPGRRRWPVSCARWWPRCGW